MIGNIARTNHAPIDASNTTASQSINLPPSSAITDAVGANTKAQFIDTTASVGESQNPRLEAPANTPNPATTKQASDTLIKTAGSYFRIPPQDDTSEAYKAIIVAFQNRNQANREKQGLQNKLSMDSSISQSNAQKEEGNKALSCAIGSAVGSVVTASVGGLAEFRGAYNERRANIGELNEKNLPGMQAEFDALQGQHQTQRQQRINSPEGQQAIRDRADLEQFPDAPDNEQLVARVENFDRDINGLYQQQANERTTKRNALEDLSQKVANLPRAAGIALLESSKRQSTGGMIVRHNMSQTIEGLMQGISKGKQMEESSKATLDGATANLYSSMSQEAGKEADSDINMIMQIIEALNKRYEMDYNSVNFFTQKIV